MRVVRVTLPENNLQPLSMEWIFASGVDVTSPNQG